MQSGNNIHITDGVGGVGVVDGVGGCDGYGGGLVGVDGICKMVKVEKFNRK